MIFTVEGNIGAGKTTFLKSLENVVFEKEHIVVYEPVDEWMNAKLHKDGPSIFEMYYTDKQRYGFMFQMYALQTRMMHMAKTVAENPDKVIICERCHLTDFEIFASMLHDQKIINDAEFMVYKSWYYSMIDLIKPHINGVIYLQVEPDVCVKRIMKRNRQGEQNISFAYIQQLHDQHESWLVGKQNNYKVLVIDGVDSVSKVVNFINHSIQTF